MKDLHDVRIDCDLCVKYGESQPCLNWEAVGIDKCSGPVSHLPTKIVKARKGHECNVCFEAIFPGSLCRVDTISIERQLYSFYTCRKCMRELMPCGHPKEEGECAQAALSENLLECDSCGHLFKASELSASNSEREPGCPSCGSDNYTEPEGGK